MNIKKALDYMISHSTKEDRPAYEQICSELSVHLELWVKDKERISELEAERDRYREALLLISGSKRESPSYCLDPKVGLAKARGISRKALEETT